MRVASVNQSGQFLPPLMNNPSFPSLPRYDPSLGVSTNYTDICVRKLRQWLIRCEDRGKRAGGRIPLFLVARCLSLSYAKLNLQLQ